MNIFLSKKMKYFMVTMDIKSFTKAAEALCITRSPLSKVISEIEEAIGEKLFRRTYNDLEPTKIAWDYYHRCKPVYDLLLKLEKDLYKKEVEVPVNIKFDISVPEILFRHIVMAIKENGIEITFERSVITLNDIEYILMNKNEMIVSLRSLAFPTCSDVQKWECDEFVIIKGNGWEEDKEVMKIAVWKDEHMNFMKRAFSLYAKNLDIEFEYIENNHDISRLIYNLKSDKYCAVMTRKLASFYNLNHHPVQVVTGLRPTVHICNNIASVNAHKLNTINKIIHYFI